MAKSIQRMNYKRNKGWWVRVFWKGRCYSKSFSDSCCGGILLAFKAAVKWRNEKEKEIGKPRTNRMIYGMNQRNTTGKLGVQRDEKGERYFINWVELDKPKRTSISDRSAGCRRRAHELAIKLRETKEQEMWKE